MERTEEVRVTYLGVVVECRIGLGGRGWLQYHCGVDDGGSRLGCGALCEGQATTSSSRRLPGMMSVEWDKARYSDDMYLAACQIRQSIRRQKAGVNSSSEKTFPNPNPNPNP